MSTPSKAIVLPALTARQYSAILCGLRLYQSLQDGTLDSQRMADLQDIATNGASQRALSAIECESLIQKFQFGT